MSSGKSNGLRTWLIVVEYTWQHTYRVCMPLFWDAETEDEAIDYGRRFCQEAFNSDDIQKHRLLVLAADHYTTVEIGE